MHIHGTHMDLNALNLSSAAEATRAAAAQRAAEIRKKLALNAAEIEGGLDPGVAFVVSQHSQQNPNQQEQDHPPAGNKKQNSDDDDPPSGPISAWA
jgi:hypothetical protein